MCTLRKKVLEPKRVIQPFHRGFDMEPKKDLPGAKKGYPIGTPIGTL